MSLEASAPAVSRDALACKDASTRREWCRWARQGPLEPVYKAALALGTANQLTNILRDVGEDAAERNRIYVPVDELAEFGISEAEARCSLCMSESGRL